MRRLESKRIVSKMPVMASKNFKKYSQAGDITDVLDTDEDRVMLYYAHKNDTNLLKRSRKAYHA